MRIENTCFPVIDSRVFGLAVAIITGNVIVLVLSILVLAHVSENNKKSMKTVAMLLFTATGKLLNKIFAYNKITVNFVLVQSE